MLYGQFVVGEEPNRQGVALPAVFNTILQFGGFEFGGFRHHRTLRKFSDVAHKSQLLFFKFQCQLELIG